MIDNKIVLNQFILDNIDLFIVQYACVTCVILRQVSQFNSFQNFLVSVARVLVRYRCKFIFH
jgi:hypothetical protein